MKENHELTRLGKIRRAHKYVKSALMEYDMDVEYIKFLTEESNMFFKIKDTNGKFYAAKLYENYSSNLQESNIEMYFLNHMSDTTSIDVPKPIKNNKDEYITEVDSFNTKKPSRIVLYEWFYGKPLDGKETTAYFYDNG